MAAHRSLLLILLNACAGMMHAQDYTTPDQYSFRVESDVVYGLDTNYLGLIDTLRLDIYTPNGNMDTERPLAVFVHGGNWLGGCKDDPIGIVPLLHQFVKRGYVVASVNYRLGWHKDDFVAGPVAGFGVTPWPPTYRSFYALDSAELKRAIYRGMQDVKGAIRYMKGRADQDSVCVDKVFVGGESAGGFIALATAFVDRPSEKPVVCGALPDAPTPYAEVANGTGFECVVHEYTVQLPMLTRPDLGPVEGDLNQNGFDASVKGVANFYGGIPFDAIDLDWWQGVDTPSVYMYHQTCDGIVLSGIGPPTFTNSAYCNLGAYPWHYNYPDMLGSVAIKSLFDGMALPPEHITDFETCPPFDPGLALFECIRYADNGSYHYTANHALRGQNLSALWAADAMLPGACLNTGSTDRSSSVPMAVYPSPASDVLNVVIPSFSGRCVVELISINGRVLLRSERLATGAAMRLELPGNLPNGPVLLRVSGDTVQWCRVVIVE